MPKAKSQRKKTILVTGGAGFIGSNYLNRNTPRYPQYDFVVVDSLTGVSDKRNIAVLNKKNVHFVRCDIRDRVELRRVFQEYNPTDVIHFAAETHVDNSIKNPIIFAETNVLGTANLLHLSYDYKLDRFHFISTDEVYGSLSPNDPSSTEESPIRPNNPYSASKASGELFVRSYEKTFGMDTVITRCSNNYGPNQDSSKLIPLFITRLLKNEQVPLYNRGKNIRDWIYVDDHVDAIDLVFHRGKSGSIYNIGGNAELYNIDVVNMLLSLTKRSTKKIKHVADRLGHDLRYSLDTTRIETELGFKPKTTFSDGLKKTFKFYKDMGSD